MTFKDFIVDNYVVFFEIFGLCLILLISSHIPSKMKKFTRIALVLLFCASIVTYIEAWTQTFEKLSCWRYILTATKYTIYPLSLLMIIETLSAEKELIPKKFKFLIYIPEIICIPIFYTSQWTHIVCYFSETNTYHGGTFKYLPYVLFVIYFIFFFVQNICYLKHYKFRDRMISIYISVGSFLCAFLYLITEAEVDYTHIFVAALVFHYLYIYIHLTSIDSLTGLMNRQTYYQDVRQYSDKIKAVVSIDMNELKYINDTFGHDMGDEALKQISNILLAKSGYYKNVYRIGGDEFIMLFVVQDEEVVKGRIENIRAELAKTKYTCAIGYAMNLDNNLEEAIKLADKNMYIDKNNMKKELIANGGEIHGR